MKPGIPNPLCSPTCYCIWGSLYQHPIMLKHGFSMIFLDFLQNVLDVRAFGCDCRTWIWFLSGHEWPPRAPGDAPAFAKQGRVSDIETARGKGLCFSVVELSRTWVLRTKKLKVSCLTCAPQKSWSSFECKLINVFGTG